METVYVITKVANLYKDSSFKSELVSQAFKGEQLLILEKSKSWYKVKPVSYTHLTLPTTHYV